MSCVTSCPHSRPCLASFSSTGNITFAGHSELGWLHSLLWAPAKIIHIRRVNEGYNRLSGDIKERPGAQEERGDNAPSTTLLLAGQTPLAFLYLVLSITPKNSYCSARGTKIVKGFQVISNENRPWREKIDCCSL